MDDKHIARLIVMYRRGKLSPSSTKELLAKIGIFPVFPYLNSNSLLDNQELISQYWFGVTKGLNTAKTRGDGVTSSGQKFKYRDKMLSYIRWCGTQSVKNYIRSTYGYHLTSICTKCHSVVLYSTHICSKCGTQVSGFKRKHISSDRAIVNDDGEEYTPYFMIQEDNSDSVINNSQIESYIKLFMQELSGSRKDIFCSLMDKKIIQSDNYIKALATKLGITTQRVSQQIKSIYSDMVRYYRKTGRSIDGNPMIKGRGNIGDRRSL